MKRIILIILMPCILIGQGCASGPVRYKVLGRYIYTTLEWTKRTPSYVKPLAASGGLITDISFIGIDTAFTPIASIPIAAIQAFYGPEPELRDFKNHPFKETTISLATFPFWFPLAYFGSLYFQTYETMDSPYFKNFYPGVWGNESELYKQNPIRNDDRTKSLQPTAFSGG